MGDLAAPTKKLDHDGDGVACE
ncbi:excalibur calcium-binding domain-containing protein [Paenibacillus jilunlii]